MPNTKLKNISFNLTDEFKIHPELLSSLGYCLSKSSQIIKERFDQELEKYDLITPQAGLLNILFHSQPINQLELGSSIGIDKATMVKLIDGLEELGLVERTTDQKDRRAKLVTITKSGKKLSEEIQKCRYQIEEDLLSEFNKKEREDIRKYMAKMLICFNSKRIIK